MVGSGYPYVLRWIVTVSQFMARKQFQGQKSSLKANFLLTSIP